MTTEVHTILIDPPWPEKGGGKIKRGADRHYPVAKVQEIPALIERAFVESDVVPAHDSHLYLWVTNTYLPDGIALMKELGWRYVTNLAWAKQRIGIGQYLRGAHELCLFGVTGDGLGLRRAHTTRRDIPGLLETETYERRYTREEVLSFGMEVRDGAHYIDGPETLADLLDTGVLGEDGGIFKAERKEHSRKPEQSYELIEAASPGPYFEVFARRPREGWIVWGNEV